MPRVGRSGGRRRLRLTAFWLALTLLLGVGPGLAAAQSLPGPYEVTRDSIRVIYWGDARGTAERTLDAALRPLPLPGLRANVVFPDGTIVLAPTRAHLDSIARGRTPDWVGGIAIPSERLIALPTYRRPGALGDEVVTLRHELAHIALNDQFDRPVPRWFDEGYATWVSGGWDAASGWQIRLALARGNAPSLDSLTLSWPRGEARARLAYLLSASAVSYLAESRGLPAFEAFIEEWRRDGSMDAAMRSVYQLTTTQFEREWRAMVRRRYGWLLAISQIGVFWIGVLLLVLLLGSARRKRNRERMDALRAEEYMLPASTGDGVDADYGQR